MVTPTIPRHQPIQLTNCDWLSFSVLLTLTEEERHTQPRMVCPAGFTLTEMDGTNMYKHRAILYAPSGDKVLTLLWQPHSKIIDGNSMFVEVANPLLYSGQYLSVLDLLQEIHPHTWQSLSRLDLATDFQPTVAQYNIIDMLATGSVYAQGKREGTMWHTYSSADKYVKRTPHQLAWGSKYSQIKWKMYNKTKEIYETTPDGRTWCNKPYIAEMWQKSGLMPDRDTWRVEVSMTGAGQLQWQGYRLTWSTITDPDTLTALFYDLYATRMKMRLNQGHENKRYDEEVEFLSIPSKDHNRIQKAIPASEQIHVAYAPTLRALLQQLERPEVAANPAIHAPLLATLEHVVTTAGLRGYFAAVTSQDIFDYCDEYREKNIGRQVPPDLKENPKAFNW